MTNVSDELKEELRRVHADGFNIYALINKTKRELKSVKAHIPDEVLLKICEKYWFDKNRIRRPYPWFLIHLKMVWQDHNARGQIKEHQQYKQDSNPRGGLATVDSILEKLMGKIDKNKIGGMDDES